ncbi:MAG: LPS-assembly protein LptD [Robiginitomaculum sp.]|nr:LPS-assembly protein LptD [Robiginitomaculum sp.]
MTNFIFLAKPLLILAVVFTSISGYAFSAEQDETSAFEKGAVYLESDEIFKDATSDIVRYVARGSVQARYENRILRADEVIYYPDLNKVHAIGSVTVVEADGTVSFADEVELDDNLTNGVAQGFYARLGNKGTIGATHAVHSNNGKNNKLKNAFYTACESCINEDGTVDKPTWRLRAREAEQDQEGQMIYYRDAIFEIKGVPVFYSPYFAHADPTAGRRTGLLFPSVGQSRKYGWFYEQPFYKVLSPYSDITLSPRVFTGKRPLISADYRKQFYSGMLRMQGGGTYEQDFDGAGLRFGDDKFRGYILGTGKFQINQNWNWGFSAEAVSDDLFFLRYDIDYYSQKRGLFSNSSRRLSTQLYTVRQTESFYGSLSAIRYQGLRAADVDDQLPIATPLLDVTKIISNNLAGGKLAFGASTAVLSRTDGIDSRRASANLDWNNRLVSKNGIIVKPYLKGRVDAYSINNQQFIADLGTDTQSFGRTLGVAGAEIRWPWLKAGKNTNWVIEPITHLSASPNGDGVGTFDVITTDNLGNIIRTPTSILSNEDSITVDFDETNLFRSTRFAGYDLWEDGLRASIGGRVTANWADQGYASLTAGRAFRSNINNGYSVNSSLRGKSSDYVAGLELSTGATLNLASHIRLNPDSFAVNRFDVYVTSSLKNDQLGPLRSVLHSANTQIRYTNIPSITPSRPEVDEISASGSMFFSKNIGLQYRNTYDFNTNEHRASSIGLIYDDDCSRFEIMFQRDNITDRTLSSGSSIRFRFTLLTLGSFGD